jgi:hypothetical protein
LRLTLETAIFTFVSFIVAFILAWGLLPVFNNLMGEQLRFELAFQPVFLCVALLIWIVTTLLAASYPVIYMSGFPPLMAIRSQFMPQSSHAIVRKVLSVGQFAVAIVLIAWVLIIQAQIKFVNNKDLGYNSRNLIGFWIHDSKPSALLDEFRAQSSVEMVTRENQSNVFGVSANLLFRDPDDQTGLPLKVIGADPNYIDLMQIKLIAGSHYPAGNDFQAPDGKEGDSIFTQILLNRAAVDYLGMTPEEAVGQRVRAELGGVYGFPVIYGVVENFHFESLYRPVSGLCLHNGNQVPL